MQPQVLSVSFQRVGHSTACHTAGLATPALPVSDPSWDLGACLPDGSDSVNDLGHHHLPSLGLSYSSVKWRGAFLSGLGRVEPEAK